MSTAVDQPVPPEEALAWEADHRTSSGLFAVSAALLTLIGSIVFSLVTADTPRVLAVTAFQDAVGERPAGSVGLKTAPLLYTNDHALELILVAIVLAAGSCLMAPALAYVYRAAAARTPRLPRLALFAALIGPIAVGVATLVLQIVVVIKSGDFASAADHTTAAAHDAVSGPFVVGTTLLRALGVLIVALAYILISLNAMRVGLLSRFMGIIGILAGALVIVGPLVAPQLSALPIIQIFWLLAVGALILRRWPGGNIPPAWDTGKAEPWPTQQEIREQRAADAAALKAEKDGAAGAADAPVTPAPVPRADDDEEDEPAGTPHSSSKKRKRKRR